MDHDDRQVGRILSRREVLTLFGAAGTAVLATCIPAQPTTQQGASVAAQALIQTASTANRGATRLYRASGRNRRLLLC